MVETLPVTLAKGEAESLGCTLDDVEVLTLVDAIPKVDAKKFGDLKCNERAETIRDTLDEKLAKDQIEVLIYTLAANFLKVKSHTFEDRDIERCGGRSNGY